MSPTIFRYRSYRFYFFSREEPRMPVHVISPDGAAKFWLEPDIELAVNQGLTATELNLEKAVETAKYVKYAKGQGITLRHEFTEMVMLAVPGPAVFQPLFSRISRISRFLLLPF